MTAKVSLKRLMIRNPKDFGVWSACPSGVHSVITELERVLCFSLLLDTIPQTLLAFLEFFKQERRPLIKLAGIQTSCHEEKEKNIENKF